MARIRLKIKTNKIVEKKKLEQIGKYLVENMKKELKFEIGKPTKLTEAIKYRLEKNKVIVYTDNEILTFIEKGTKSHIIRPKKAQALSFRAGNSGTYKNGGKFQFGDRIFAKEVHHPGTDPRPFFSRTFFKSKPVIEKVLNMK